MSAPPLRRTDRRMDDAETEAALRGSHCGRLALVGPDGWPYCVPLLYVWRDRTVWLHGTAARGHLRAAVEHEPRVCFEIDAPGEVFDYGRFECDVSVSYASVIAFGRIRVVDDRADKQRFCEDLMAKYGRPDSGRPKGFFPRLDAIAVYALSVERLTGKHQTLPPPAEQWPAVDRTKTPDARPPG